MFPKPSKARGELNRYFAKQERLRAKQREKKNAQIKAFAEWAGIRETVYLRDGGRCRAYGNRIYRETGCKPDLMHAHHIVFRSAGGGNELSNLIALSGEAHAQVHEHLLDCEGDGNGVVTFTSKDTKGRVLHVWTSGPARSLAEVS